MSSRPQAIEVGTETETIRSDAYRQLGGMTGVSAAIKRFYKEMSRDPVLHPLFRESDLNWLTARQTQCVAQALGEPITYKGPAMKHVHAFLGITERHRWMVERHLSHSLALAKSGLQYKVIRAIVALLEPV